MKSFVLIFALMSFNSFADVKVARLGCVMNSDGKVYTKGMDLILKGNSKVESGKVEVSNNGFTCKVEGIAGVHPWPISIHNMSITTPNGDIIKIRGDEKDTSKILELEFNENKCTCMI